MEKGEILSDKIRQKKKLIINPLLESPTLELTCIAFAFFVASALVSGPKNSNDNNEKEKFSPTENLIMPNSIKAIPDTNQVADSVNKTYFLKTK